MSGRTAAEIRRAALHTPHDRKAPAVSGPGPDGQRGAPLSGKVTGMAGIDRLRTTDRKPPPTFTGSGQSRRFGARPWAGKTADEWTPQRAAEATRFDLAEAAHKAASPHESAIVGMAREIAGDRDAKPPIPQAQGADRVERLNALRPLIAQCLNYPESRSAKVARLIASALDLAE